MIYSYLVLIPLIAGIGEVLKYAGVPSRYIPFINLVIGVLLGFVLCYTNSKACLIDGLFIGLSASGLTRSSKEIYKLFTNRHLDENLHEDKRKEHDACDKEDLHGWFENEEESNSEEEFEDDE